MLHELRDLHILAHTDVCQLARTEVRHIPQRSQKLAPNAHSPTLTASFPRGLGDREFVAII